MTRAGCCLLLAGLLLVGCTVRLADSAGPWRAQIVDAETKQPLESVVVLAVWWKKGPIITHSTRYYDSEEVLTGRDGRFTIAARRYASPLSRFHGPEFLIFKPGYGRAVWPEYETWSAERKQGEGGFHSVLQRDGIVLEMSRLRTLEERRRYLRDARGGFVAVPDDRMPLTNRAIADEARVLGLEK